MCQHPCWRLFTHALTPLSMSVHTSFPPNFFALRAWNPQISSRSAQRMPTPTLPLPLPLPYPYPYPYPYPLVFSLFRPARFQTIKAVCALLRVMCAVARARGGVRRTSGFTLYSRAPPGASLHLRSPPPGASLTRGFTPTVLQSTPRHTHHTDATITCTYLQGSAKFFPKVWNVTYQKCIT